MADKQSHEKGDGKKDAPTPKLEVQRPDPGKPVKFSRGSPKRGSRNPKSH